MSASLADLSSISHSLFSPIWCSYCSLLLQPWVYISLSFLADFPTSLRLTCPAS